LLLGILFPTFVCAQEQGSDDRFYVSTIAPINPEHEVNFEVGLPIIMGNKFDRTYMDGLVYFAPYYQYAFENHLSIGVGAVYNYLKIQSTAIAQPLTGANHTVGGFLKVAFEKFHSDRFATDMGVKLGYAHAFYVSNALKDQHLKSQQSGLYIEPNIGFILTAAEKSSFRFFIAYNIVGMKFNNKMIGMESDGEMSGKDFKAPQQYFTIGFGYTFYAKSRM